MEEIVVKKTIYVTDEGKRFDDLESAQKHEKHLKALEKLNTFKIDGPNFTPFDEYRIPTYDWQWYKVHDQEELVQVLRLTSEVYAMENCSDNDDFDKVKCRFYHDMNLKYDWVYRCMNSEQRSKSFPKYIAISFDHKAINTLDNIEKEHEDEMKKWEKFYQAFKNELKKDIESDDYYKGAQEEC